MNMKVLVDVGKMILTNPAVALQFPLDLRTIRYYHAMSRGTKKKLLDDPKRVGRENHYTIKHLKQLVALKTLQAAGYSLEQIKKQFETADLDGLLADNGFNVAAMERLVKEFDVEARDAQKEGEVSSKSKNGGVKKIVRKPHNKTAVVASVDEEPKGELLSVSVTNPAEYESIRPHARIGSAFAFLDGVKGDAARKLHVLLNGQRAGAGEVSRAIFPVDDKGVDLPGCTLKGRAASKDTVCIMIPDKDVYKEGSGVARVFVFDPASKNSKVSASISLDGAGLDKVEVDLDGNGCGLLRYPTLVSGTYQAELVGRPASCRFVGARYELAPLTVVIESSRKEGADSIKLSLAAESFGSPYSGKCHFNAMEDGSYEFLNGDIEFKDGKFELPLNLAGRTGAISLLFSDASDPRLVASAPIQGARKSEREGTEVSTLGAVTSVSLLQGAASITERGLSFDKGAVTNSPVTLLSCVAGAINLRFNEDADNIVVFVRDASGSSVHELGSVRMEQPVVPEKSVKFQGAVAAFHVGMFLGDKPWEGHAAVVAPAEGKLSIEAPAEARPGDTVTLKVKAPANSSVLVKILDKRLRVQDEAVTSAAAKLKQWISDVITGRHTGRVVGRLPEYVPIRAYSAFGGGGVYGSASFGAGAQSFGSLRALRAASTRPLRSKSLLSSSNDKWVALGPSEQGQADITMYSAKGDQTLASYMRDTGNSAELISRRGMVPESDSFVNHASDSFDEVPVASSEVELASVYFEADAVAKVQEEKKTRESEADILYCDLLEVSGQREVTIKLPDAIGAYDVKAFGVSSGGQDWIESAASMRVTKKVYVEPMIPQFAHPQDGVKARAVIVGAPEGSMFNVRVDGEFVRFEQSRRGGNVHLKWPATPGVHEVSVVSDAGSDKVARIVEEPGEEIVLTQELVILKKGKKFDLAEDDALSFRLLPGIQSELKIAVSVCVDFQHSCCEQTSAKLVAAFMAMMTGDDSSKDSSAQAIVNGEARLRSMYHQGRGFDYYPHGSINAWASATAAKRLNLVMGAIGNERLPKSVAGATASLKAMAADVARAHGSLGDESSGKMEAAYSDKRKQVGEADVRALLAALESRNAYHMRAEACYCAAALLSRGEIDEGIKVANAAAKAMGGANGGGWHGTVESLAYMHMVNELRASGVVPGAKGTTVKLDGEKMPLEKAMEKTDASSVEAVDGAVAIKVNRIEKIRFDKANSNVPISVELVGEDGRAPKAGKPATLVVKLTDGYKQGDVLCVALPNCLSQMVGGAMAKKVQVDFAGKNEVRVQLVAHEATSGEKWASVVRNMYHPERIGSVGQQVVAVTAR